MALGTPDVLNVSQRSILRAGRRSHRFSSSGYLSFRQSYTGLLVSSRTSPGLFCETPLSVTHSASRVPKESQKVTPILYRTADSLQNSYAAKHLRDLQPPRSTRGTMMFGNDNLCASPELSMSNCSAALDSDKGVMHDSDVVGDTNDAMKGMEIQQYCDVPHIAPSILSMLEDSSTVHTQIDISPPAQCILTRKRSFDFVDKSPLCPRRHSNTYRCGGFHPGQSGLTMEFDSAIILDDKHHGEQSYKRSLLDWNVHLYDQKVMSGCTQTSEGPPDVCLRHGSVESTSSHRSLLSTSSCPDLSFATEDELIDAERYEPAGVKSFLVYYRYSMIDN